MQIEFIDEPFEIEIRNGNVILSRRNAVTRAMPISVFRMECARAIRALADYDARGVVLPLKRKRVHS